MAINETITLQGVPQVKEQLAQVTAASQQTSAAINAIGAEGAAGTGIQNVFVSLDKGAASMKEATTSANGLRDATHALKPALTDLGASAGPLREFARLGAEGFGLLGVALGGALITSIQKAGDEIGNLKRQLDLLLGGEAGKTAFDALKKSADDLHTSVSNLLPAFQALANAQQRSSSFRTISGTGADISVTRGLPGDPQKAVDVITALNKAMQQTTGDAATAAAAVNEFFKTITKFDPSTKTAIGLTLDEFLKLQDQAPEIAKALEKAFGPGLFERLQQGAVSLNEVLTKLAATAPDWAKVAPPDTLATSLDEVKTAWKDLLETLANEGVFGIVTSFFNDLAKGIQDSITQINQMIEVLNNLKSIWQQLQTLGPSSGAGIGSGLEVPQFASGGVVRGPGTGTSDSILARLSAGEFIISAAAARHWGSGFLAALNSMQVPQLKTSQSIPRFAGGGTVGTTPPAAVHLHFPGGASFQTAASETVATSLRHYATKSRYISIGPKPSWY